MACFAYIEDPRLIQRPFANSYYFDATVPGNAFGNENTFLRCSMQYDTTAPCEFFFPSMFVIVAQACLFLFVSGVFFTATFYSSRQVTAYVPGLHPASKKGSMQHFSLIRDLKKVCIRNNFYPNAYETIHVTLCVQICTAPLFSTSFFQTHYNHIKLTVLGLVTMLDPDFNTFTLRVSQRICGIRSLNPCTIRATIDCDAGDHFSALDLPRLYTLVTFTGFLLNFTQQVAYVKTNSFACIPHAVTDLDII